MIYTMSAYKLDVIKRTSYLDENEVVRELIDCFKVNKYQSIDEHILYIAMKVSNLIDKPQHIDVIFDKYSKESGIELSLNLERLLYLALTFLFSIGMVEIDGNMIRRIK